jgi:uncharacterized protein (TIGR03437 family)
VVNAASFNLGPAAVNTALAPGSLVTIFGEGLGWQTRSADSFPLPLSLALTTVTMNGVPAPLLYVSPAQINAQVPVELTGSMVEIRIFNPTGVSEGVSLPLASTQPGIFFDIVTGLGAIVNVADGTPIWERPARAGSFVQVFGTGFGHVEPSLSTGLPAPASPPAITVLPPRVLLDGREANFNFSGLAPAFAGLYQLNVELPPGLLPGRHALSVVVGGRSSNEVFLDVE